MDLEFKAPSLESFYSPNHQQRSLSPIWAEKDKPEEDVDTAISDGDDQGSVQGADIENSNDNGCNESLNDALEWENGIGTLAGSDLKFRMNEHGDIEVITESFDFDPLENSNHHHGVNGTSEDNVLENGHSVEESIHASVTPMESENVSKTIKDVPLSGHLEDANFDGSEGIKDENQIQHSAVKTEINDEKENQDSVEMADSPLPEEAEIASSNGSIIEDNLLEFDPVLSEDMAAMLSGNTVEDHTKIEMDSKITKTEHNEEGIKTPEKIQESKSPPVAENITEVTGPSKCIICGRPSTLANRFCSRQCLGKNAAKQRRANLLAVNKKSKGKKTYFGKRRSRVYSSPHPNDVLTVVHDQSPGKRNDLKIKIRWSSSVSNGNRDDDYSPEPREMSKRRAAAAAGNYAYAGYVRGPRRRRFSWSTYMSNENATSASPEAFQEVTGRNSFPKENHFEIGMALEGVDPEHEALICPLFIAEVRGCRIRLSFCGYEGAHDFWRDIDSELIFPCGFCKETNRILQSPKGYDRQNFDWNEYCKIYRLYRAPENLFATKTVPSSSQKFVAGQKLEAVDKHNPGLVCVATVQDVINDQVLIHFDGWSHDFDFWCKATSNHIHPVGWCQENKNILSPPFGYNEAETFCWERYLVKTNSTAADKKFFSNCAVHRFEVGMRLEAVDLRNKVLVRVATIAEIKDFQLKIHFDGWSDMYDFWTHVEDPDLHPVGWCEKTGHPLEPPVTLDEISDSSWQTGGCPIPGCRGVGHIQGAKFQNHYSEFGCPYSPQNLSKEQIKDRLSTHRPRRSTQTQEDDQFHFEEDADFVVPEADSITRSARGRKRNSGMYDRSSPIPERKKTRGRYGASHETTYAAIPRNPSHNTELVSKWSTNDVAKFVEEVTSEPLYGTIFSKEEIDGRAILMLSQADILTVLKIKLGPAVKIYNAISTIKEMQ